MTSVVLKKGTEEPWASERVARFINSFGYKEITLKSDTEPAMIASRNRVAENCNAVVRLEDAVEGDKRSRRIDRKRNNVVTRCHQDYEVPCGELHPRRPPRRLPNFAVAGGTCGGHLVHVSESVGTVGRHSESKSAVRDSERRSEPLNRMNPRYKHRSVVGSEKQRVPSAAWGRQKVDPEREVRRTEQQDMWDKEAINNVIGLPWRMVDDKWTVDRPVTQDPLSPPPVPFEGARAQRERITRADIEAFWNHCRMPRVAMRSDLESEHKHTPTPAEPGLRNVSKRLQKDLSARIEEERC